MTSFAFNSSSTTAQTLVSGESGFIGQNGALYVNGADAITASDSVSITVLGSLYAYGGAYQAIDANSSYMQLNIGEAGYIGSASSDAVSLIVSTSTSITNAGNIYGGDDGIQVSTSDGGAGFTLQNSGIVSADDDAVSVNHGTGAATFINTGQILGDYWGIRSYGTGSSYVQNSGTITGLVHAINLDAGNDSVVNTGTIFGDVELQEGADTLVNAGVLNGDVMLGSGADTFDGRGGTVVGTVFGGLEDDTYIVDDATTQISENADEGTDEVRSTVNFALGANFENLTLLGAEHIDGKGNELSNTIFGNSGNNDLRGLDGADTIEGFAGDDAIYGGEGSDSLTGGFGADSLFGGDGGDVLAGGNGDDLLQGKDGDDTLKGWKGDDVLEGGGGNDSLIGSFGHDTLDGGSGKDTLAGGDGDDLLTGGLQADLFVFTDGFGNDTIADFASTWNAEKIDLSGVAAITGFTDLSNNHMNQVGSDVVIDDGAGNTITLENVGLGELDAGDFLF